MTLTEAIEHARTQAWCHEGTGCGDEHAQLAEWLEELQERRREAVPVNAFHAMCPACGASLDVVPAPGTVIIPTIPINEEDERLIDTAMAGRSDRPSEPL